MSTHWIPTLAVAMSCALPAAAALAGAHDINCKKAVAGSTEALVCQDPGLSALDRVIGRVFAAASRKAVNEHPPVLKAEQRGWIKRRNDCWKSDDRRSCVEQAYRLRIVELQVRYRLVPAVAEARYVCDDSPGSELLVTFFQTDPASLIAERGDSNSLMYQQISASGTRYQGRNESFWEHQGEARVTWGFEAPEMHCKKTAAINTSANLQGSAWQLRAIQSMDDAQGTTQISEPQRYTIRFNAGGRLALRLDCNRGMGTWQSTPAADRSGSLELGPVAGTRALCGPASLDQKLLRDLPYVRSYVLKGGRLFMSLMADGGIYEWEEIRQEVRQDTR